MDKTTFHEIDNPNGKPVTVKVGWSEHQGEWSAETLDILTLEQIKQERNAATEYLAGE